MPFVFIHGVNTRDGGDYQANKAARDELIRQLILRPLATRDARFEQMEIVSPYWGDLGVTFHWDQATLPRVGGVEQLGAAGPATPQADVELAGTVKQLAGGEPSPAGLERLGAAEGAYKRAALADPRRFVEAVLAPIVLSETRLEVRAGDRPETIGRREALLLAAGWQVAAQPGTRQALAAAASDDEVLRVLKERVRGRFEELLVEQGLAPPAAGPAAAGLEHLGPSWLPDLLDRAGELFDRARDAPGRAVSVPVLEQYREGLHRNFSRFMGDVFIYLIHRDGERAGEARGQIVARILDALRQAPRHSADEPLIVMTHSMGGNILYDLLTYYAPDLRLDAWISAGGQVGQFEEMKLFKASDEGIRAPQRVTGLKPRVRYWLNVYDPCDVFGFKVAPVFADVDDDVEYASGASAAGAHGAYFKRPSFYDLVRERLEGALL